MKYLVLGIKLAFIDNFATLNVALVAELAAKKADLDLAKISLL
jgi:hypothetical protein